MRSLRVVLGTFGATLLMVWLGAWSATAGQSAASHENLAIPTPAISASEAVEFEVAPSEAVVDRYGNQVERAVTDYRIDHRGDVYERHSPQTALPRLARAES